MQESETLILKNGITVCLRQMKGRDYQQAMLFLRQMASETIFTNQYPDQPDKDKEQCIETYENPNNFFKGVFLPDGKMIGLVSACIMKPNHPWSGFSCDFGISILKDYYGNGLGTKLMQDMEEWARDKKMHSIMGGVRAGNVRAIGLYLKCGFQIDGLFRQTAFINGQWHDMYHITKILE